MPVSSMMKGLIEQASMLPVMQNLHVDKTKLYEESYNPSLALPQRNSPHNRENSEPAHYGSMLATVAVFSLPFYPLNILKKNPIASGFNAIICAPNSKWVLRSEVPLGHFVEQMVGVYEEAEIGQGRG